jgi:cysteine synthase
LSRDWLNQAIEILEADFQRSADTHLIPVPLPFSSQLDLYFKDESTHPTGSLKHRLARSLFLYGLCNGWIGPQTSIIEASSGSTAVSEAYFARLLGLRFLAVMARTTSPEKIRRIQRYGGECVFVDNPREDRAEAARLAQELGGHFMDQFTYAERATDWRGNNNIAESLFEQLERERFPIPLWIVVGAGTGGTSATLGRYVRYKKLATQLCVADPESSVFHHFWESRDAHITLPCGSGIEGIGRPQVEPSFLPQLVDRMLAVPNAASLAAMHFLEDVLGRRVGASTGTSFWALCQLLSELHSQGASGSVVTLICDSGELYRESYYSQPWLTTQGYDLAPATSQLQCFWQSGAFQGK